MSERRWKRVAVSWDILLAVVTLDGTKTVKCEGVPPDATVVRPVVNYETRTVELILDHESFPAVAVVGTADIPFLPVTVSEVPPPLPTGVFTESWPLPTFTADELVQFREEWERQFMRVRASAELHPPPEVRLVGFSRGDECDEPAVVGGKK